MATNDTSPFKIESGTYDLIAAAQVSMQMKNLSYVVETLLAGEVPTYLTTLGIGHETIRLPPKRRVISTPNPTAAA